MISPTRNRKTAMLVIINYTQCQYLATLVIISCTRFVTGHTVYRQLYQMVIAAVVTLVKD